MMEDNLQILWGLQAAIAALLFDDNFGGGDGADYAQLLIRAFGSLSPSEIYEALQHLVMETLGDLYMRFTCHYKGFPEQLARLAVDSTPDDEKLLVAQTFCDLPECCCKPDFELRLKAQYPTVPELMSEEALAVIKGWATTCRLCTKTVEWAHRSNAAVARSKGPAQPSDLHTVADASILHRLQGFIAFPSSRQFESNRRIATESAEFSN